MIHQLEQLQQPIADAPRPNLQRTLAGLRRVAHPGSLVAMISDFAGFDEVCAAHLRALAAHNNLMVCFVYDELERQLPPAGVYPIQVGQQRLQVDTGGAQAARWTERFDARVTAVESICRATGSALRLIDTQASPLVALQSMTGKVR